jgi:hypothetical protein
MALMSAQTVVSCMLQRDRGMLGMVDSVAEGDAAVRPSVSRIVCAAGGLMESVMSLSHEVCCVCVCACACVDACDAGNMREKIAYILFVCHGRGVRPGSSRQNILMLGPVCTYS